MCNEHLSHTHSFSYMEFGIKSKLLTFFDIQDIKLIHLNIYEKGETFDIYDIYEIFLVSKIP